MIKKILKILSTLLILVIVGALVAFGIFWSKFSAIQTDTKKAKPLATKGVYNVLLLGIDTRDTNNLKDARSDVNMLCTIDSNQKRIMLTSFMRDILVDVPGHEGKYKLNSAYFLGGHEATENAIRNSFGVNIDRYVVVDFKRSAKIINILGGVRVKVKPEEIPHIKPALKNPDYSMEKVYRLNGKQATSYMRIRKVGNSDYERTQRQRTVLQNLIKKARKMSVLELSSIMEEVPKFVKTNASATDILTIAVMAKQIEGNIEQIRIPINGLFKDDYYNGAAVLVPDFEANKNEILKFLSPQGVTVK